MDKTNTVYYNCYRFITGPTGPQGPTGPTGMAAATISVNQTTTGAPGTEAQVTNIGTENNVILDFTIPQGIQGEQGSIGPTGPANGLNSFGGLYDETPNVIVANPTTPQIITIANELPTTNLNYTNNTLNIVNSGIYEISYRAIVSTTTVEDAITIAVQKNNQDIPGTITTIDLLLNQDIIIQGNIIASLNSNDNITLTLLSGQEDSLTVNVDDIYLIAKQIN